MMENSEGSADNADATKVVGEEGKTAESSEEATNQNTT